MRNEGSSGWSWRITTEATLGKDVVGRDTVSASDGLNFLQRSGEQFGKREMESPCRCSSLEIMVELLNSCP